MIVRWATVVVLAFAAVQFLVPGARMLPRGFDFAQATFGIAFALAAVAVAVCSRGCVVVGAVAAALFATVRLPPTLANGRPFDWGVVLASLSVAVALPWSARAAGHGASARRGRRLATASMLALVAAVASLGWQTFGDRPARTASAVAWSDFGPGIERSAALGRPVLVDFFAQWCQPCKVMDRVTFADPRVAAKLESSVIAVRVDAEGTASVAGHVGVELAELYDVDSYPTVVLLGVDGREVARSRGVKRPEAFLAWLDAALANSRTR